MKLVMYLDIDTPNLHDEYTEDVELEKENILTGLVSVDMQNAMAECLGAYYVSLMAEDVAVVLIDSVEIRPLKDNRKVPTFRLKQTGSIFQEGA